LFSQPIHHKYSCKAKLTIHTKISLKAQSSLSSPLVYDKVASERWIMILLDW